MTRRPGWSGIAFVACVLVSAALVSLPPSTWTPVRIAAFYHAHAAAVVITQLVGLLSVVPFVLLLRGILRSALRPTRTGSSVLAGAGAAVAVANALTTAPVLVLALLNAAAPQTWARLARLSELSDDVLFAAIAVFAAALAYAADRSWLRMLAGLVAAAALGQTVAGYLSNDSFEVVAPSAFLALILVVSGRLLLGEGSLPQPAPGQPSATR